MAMRTLEFFFDYSSPFSYLAATQIDHVVRRTSALLTYRPFLLGGLLKALGAPIVPLHAYAEPKRRYMLRDMQRWAHHWGVPFRFPTRFPLDTRDPLRLTFLVDDADKDLLVERLFTAYWAEDRDPADRDDLKKILEELDLDTNLLTRLDAVETKVCLRTATDEAIERGICGAPTFVIDDRLVWGQDRLTFVASALNGWRPRCESPSFEDPFLRP